MRVVVHHPERKEGEETIPESVSAYRMGRIEDFVNPLTGETTPRDQVAAALLEQAKEEFPGLEVSIEHLHEVEHDPETGKPVAHEWRDHPPETPAADGETHEVELTATQGQEASSA